MKNTKGKVSAVWRILLYGRMRDDKGEVCTICLKESQWGNRCCWECDRFDICVQRWNLPLFVRAHTKNFLCPYGTHPKKDCSRVGRRIEEIKNG